VTYLKSHQIKLTNNIESLNDDLENIMAKA